MKKKGILVLVLIGLLFLLGFLFLFGSQKEGLIQKDYIQDMDEKVTELDDIYKDMCEGKKSIYPLSDPYKKSKMLDVINTMQNDNTEHTYKTDLKRVLEDESITDDSVILKNTSEKIQSIKTEIIKLSIPTTTPS